MKKEDLKDFELFLNARQEPPPALDQAIVSRIRMALHPSLSKAVSKLFAFYAVGSVATLLLCPQYGLSLTGAAGIMPFLMHVHPALCFFVCGLLWMLGGQALASLFLTWDEQRVLSRHLWGTGFSFILFSVLAFACVGSLTFDLWLLYWALGAGAVLAAFDIRVRFKVRRIKATAAFR